MMRAKSSYAVVVAALLFLGGCASGATAPGMTVKAAEITAPARPEVAQAVGVSAVSGGQATDPLWTSQISNKDFAKALVSSLRNAGLLSEGANARYLVKAELIALEQPLVGFSMKVTSRIRYTLTDAKTGAVVFAEEIVAPHTATMGDAMIGTQRLRLANEGSARKSIAALIAKLNAAPAPAPRAALSL